MDRISLFLMFLFNIYLSQLYGNIWKTLEQKSSISHSTQEKQNEILYLQHDSRNGPISRKQVKTGSGQ